MIPSSSSSRHCSQASRKGISTNQQLEDSQSNSSNASDKRKDFKRQLRHLKRELERLKKNEKLKPMSESVVKARICAETIIRDAETALELENDAQNNKVLLADPIRAQAYEYTVADNERRFVKHYQHFASSEAGSTAVGQNGKSNIGSENTENSLTKENDVKIDEVPKKTNMEGEVKTDKGLDKPGLEDDVSQQGEVEVDVENDDGYDENDENEMDEGEVNVEIDAEGAEDMDEQEWNEEVINEDDKEGEENDDVQSHGENPEANLENEVVSVEDIEETEGEAPLNISVEESDVLGIEQDSKSVEDDLNEEGDDSKNEGQVADDENPDDGENIASTIREEESDNKAAEGGTDLSEGTATGKDYVERHIILVTGISSDTSANDLKTFFRRHGKIGRIKIMTNTRVVGSQRFAHISVPSLDELNVLVEKLNGAVLKGKAIRVAKAPEDGSVSLSYEIAVATANAEAVGSTSSSKEDSARKSESNDGEPSLETADSGKDTEKPDDAQNVKEGTSKGKDRRDSDSTKRAESDKKKEDKKESPGDKKTPEKSSRPDRAALHRSRKESHDRPRGEHFRPNRPFRRDKDSTEWKRHGPPRGPMEVTRVQRDRPPAGRGLSSHPGARRRSPHASQLTFEQIREIRDEQRRREHERRKREEERERAAEVERQKRLEYQNYMEFKQLEREREKLRLERERIEREKLELIKLERERQKAEREKIEREKEELRRAKLNIEHPRSSGPVKRPYEEDKVSRGRDSNERKKPFVGERGRPEPKTEAERKMERERYLRDRMHAAQSSDGRGRSPFRASEGTSRESRRDVWARDERERPGRVRTRSPERSHRRETEAEKVAAAERRAREAREAPSRAAASSSDFSARHPIDSSHSSGRGSDSAKRYDDVRATSSRDGEWLPRSYLTPSSSLSMPLSTSTSTSRDSWPFADRKIEAWDTSRLAPRTEQWISGAGATVGAAGRSSLPVMAPPPPIYSSSAASLALQGGLSLGGYAAAERYDGYRGGFHAVRKY